MIGTRTERSARQRTLAVGLSLAALFVLSVLAARPAEAAPNVFTVDRSDDPDLSTVDNCTAGVAEDCSLRGAIEKANKTTNDAAGPDEIRFNIPGAGPHTIAPSSPLPDITGTVTVDGYTEPGASERTGGGINAVLKIVLDGSTAGDSTNGLTLDTGAEGTTIKGLVIHSFGDDGLLIRAGAAETTIEGNYIGTNAAGDIDLGNTDEGVQINSSDNRIGGTSPGARNVISGNDRDGVLVFGSASNNRIEGNLIGTDANGTSDLGNDEDGVTVTSASGNFVGGPGASNLISGNAEHGVLIDGGATNNSLQSNFIGTNVFGSAALENGDEGVEILEGSNNVIGGTASRTGNIISGNNTQGVELKEGASNNSVQGNLIGTGQNGASDLGNSEGGVFVRGPNNTVGGTVSGARNVISGNDADGVVIVDTGATGNTVQGNRIGTDFNGTTDLGNTFAGVDIDGASNNTIGGTASGAGNTISGNDSDGIEMDESGTVGNRIEGNLIGTKSDGTGDLGNTRSGVQIRGASGNFVGGSVAGAGNAISGNDEQGVVVSGAGAAANRILRNSIFDNGRLAIDLQGGDEGTFGFGVTKNDPKDPDLGPNRLQNFPDLASATVSSSGQVTITGNLNSNPSTLVRKKKKKGKKKKKRLIRQVYTVQFFSSPAPNAPSGFGEGQTFIGETVVVTNTAGSAPITFTPGQTVSAGEVVTATATRNATGDTSEFSAAREVR